MSVLAAFPGVGSSWGCTRAPFGASLGAHTLAGAFALLAAAVPAQAAGPLTDTGITSKQCYAAGSNDLVSCKSAAAKALNPHQDGMTGLDVQKPGSGSVNGKLGLRYRKIGADGRALLPTATEWSCVKDKITGLMWEVKTADGGLRDQSKTYTNWGDNRSGDASDFVAPVNAAGLCGHNDWRLPTADELQSLVVYGVGIGSGKAAIDATFFPESPFSNYWTSSPLVGYAAHVAWVVDFSYGYVYSSGRANGNHVRLVRVAAGS